MRVKEIEVTFEVRGTHKQTIIVPDDVDLEMLQEQLEKDICHTSTAGKVLIKTGEDDRIELVGDIVKQEPSIKYFNFKAEQL